MLCQAFGALCIIADPQRDQVGVLPGKGSTVELCGIFVIFRDIMCLTLVFMTCRQGRVVLGVRVVVSTGKQVIE